MAFKRRSLNEAGFRGSVGPFGKSEALISRAASSSCDALLVLENVGLRLNQDVAFGSCMVLAALSTVPLRLMPSGRSVSVGLYSITNSLSSFSLVGDTGAPSLIGADSPLNKSPKILCGACGLSFLSGVEAREVLLVFNFGTKAANDFARE